jgi:hypothetical protein
MPKTFGKLRTRVRASRRMRMSKCIHRHASRRIAAQRCWAGGVLVRAVMLLSMRGETHGAFWRSEANGEHACWIRAKPTCGCRKRAPAPIPCFRLLFTTRGATSTRDTGIRRSSETLAPLWTRVNALEAAREDSGPYLTTCIARCRCRRRSWRARRTRRRTWRAAKHRWRGEARRRRRSARSSSPASRR